MFSQNFSSTSIAITIPYNLSPFHFLHTSKNVVFLLWKHDLKSDKIISCTQRAIKSLKAEYFIYFNQTSLATITM